MATLSECEREAAPAHERLLAAVSAADALPRGTAFEKVKGARDRLRGELSSAQRFLSVLAGTYDDTVRNIDIDRAGYLRHSFIAGFPTERVPKMPLSGVSTRSGDLLGSLSRRSTARPDSLSAGDALWHRSLRACLTSKGP